MWELSGYRETVSGDAFGDECDHHDLLRTAGWEASSTMDRWLAVRELWRQVGCVELPSLPTHLEDRFREAVSDISDFLIGDNPRIVEYLSDPVHGNDRLVDLLGGEASVDEWMLAGPDVFEVFVPERMSLKTNVRVDQVMFGGVIDRMGSRGPEWVDDVPGVGGDDSLCVVDGPVGGRRGFVSLLAAAAVLGFMVVFGSVNGPVDEFAELCLDVCADFFSAVT
jgi:hypothetical protein